MPNQYYDPYPAQALEKIAFYQGGGGRPQERDTVDKIANSLGALNEIVKPYAEAKLKDKSDQKKLMFEFRTKMAEAHPESFKTAKEMEDFVRSGITDRPMFQMVSQPEGPRTGSPNGPEAGSLPAPLLNPQQVATGREPITFGGKLGESFTPEQVSAMIPGADIESLKKQFPKGIPKDALASITKGSAAEKVPTDNTPLTIDQGWADATGWKVGMETTLGAAKARASQQGKQFNPMADVRGTQSISSDLPSNQGPSKVPGAASQIQLAARQGMALIAKPGSPQQIALASSDLARAVQRSAPQMETLGGASFANNYTTQISALAQKITADPTSKDVPKLRRQMYDILKDLRESSKPYISNQLDTVEDMWKNRLPKNWPDIRKREMGENIPDIEFQEMETPAKESGLITPGNIDFNNRPKVNNADGSYSTVRTITVEMGGKTVLLPTVINGKIVSNDEAIHHYKQTGEHMGIFKDQKSADAYDEKLHRDQGWTGPKNIWSAEDEKRLQELEKKHAK